MKNMGKIDKCKMLWLVAIFVFYPLFAPFGYYRVNITKFATGTGAILVCFFLWLCLAYIEQMKMLKGDVKQVVCNCVKKFHVTDWCVLVYGLTSVIAFLLAENKQFAFQGGNDRFMGLFWSLCMILLYFFARGNKWNLKWVNMTIGIGLIVVIVVASLQFLGINVFNMYSGNFSREEYINMLSPLGNTALFGKYLVLLMSFVIYRCISAKEKLEYWVSLCVSSLFLTSALIANTDATVLGYFVAMCLLFAFAITGKKTLARFFCITGINLLVFALYAIIYMNVTGHKPISSIGWMFIHHRYSLLVVGLVCIVLAVLVEWFVKDYANKKIGYVCIGIFMGAAVIALVFFIYYSAINRTATIPFGGKYLRFSKEWGTERGYVWTWLWTIFVEANPLNKLFGHGQGSVLTLLINHYETEMDGLGYYFDNAHNVYLHELICTGTVGVISYVGACATAVIRGLRNKDNAGIAIALAACFVMDIFMIKEPITMIYVWYFIGVVSEKE